ncbi:MAG TPA: molybdenum cofactor guanylyltransferase, partial [Candidatus Sulfotelmatobacter sp.]|nr:molybdenum cofactor guanylyltransferase [Candidatus Sulfotelmatobacter sp.]
MIRLPLAAAVLVGGRSRRMGWDKAGLAVGGSPMLRRLVATLQPLFPEIWLVGTADSPLEDQAIRAVPDRQPGRGPLGGLQAALLATSAPAVFCLACDMPFANPVVIRYLCELRDGVQAVVPRTAAGYEPLHALYQRTCLPTIEASLAAGDVSLQRLLASLHIRAVAGT